MSDSKSAKPLPDTTLPANVAILGYTGFGVACLFALVPFFHSYFDGSRHSQREEHIESSYRSEQLEAYRADQRRRLAAGSLPIDDAMEQLGARGRGAFPLIRPAASEDFGALDGPLAEEFGEVADAAPSEIKDAFQTMAEALGTLADQLDVFGQQFL